VKRAMTTMFWIGEGVETAWNKDLGDLPTGVGDADELACDSSVWVPITDVGPSQHLGVRWSIRGSLVGNTIKTNINNVVWRSGTDSNSRSGSEI
jgi:hypothetical protein